MPDSRFNNFPLAQHSGKDISKVDEDTESTINTTFNFFYPLKKLSTNMPNIPTSTATKNTIGHYSLPSSDSATSLRLSSIGLPETFILTSNAPTKIYDKLVIDKSVISINTNAFQSCSSLKEIVFGEKLNNIGSNAFDNCTSLEKITLPISTTYGQHPFTNTNAINSVTLLVGTGIAPNLQGTYGSDANHYSTTPWYNKTIDTIIIPEGVTTLGNYCFYNCKAINIVIPNTVTKISSNTFYNAPHITYNGTATGSPWGALAIN